VDLDQPGQLLDRYLLQVTGDVLAEELLFVGKVLDHLLDGGRRSVRRRVEAVSQRVGIARGRANPSIGPAVSSTPRRIRALDRPRVTRLPVPSLRAAPLAHRRLLHGHGLLLLL
jgi:hypothetical protein